MSLLFIRRPESANTYHAVVSAIVNIRFVCDLDFREPEIITAQISQIAFQIASACSLIHGKSQDRKANIPEAIRQR
jgi:hypothetical protein